MEKKPNKFLIGSIIIILLLLGVVKVILSGMQELESSEVQPASMKPADVAERIKPVGDVTVGKAPEVKTASAKDSSDSQDNSDGSDVAPTGLKRGKQVVNQVCAMCHEAGMMGAPKIGNKADWAPRIEKGMNTLYNHAMNGFKMMPARGGNPQLSDADIKAAVDYMVSQAK